MNTLVPVLILSIMGVVFGVALAFASKAFAVKEDERIAQIREILPGANCAACGYTGCDAFTVALTEGNAAANLCIVGGRETAERIGNILGVKAGVVERKTARVKCARTEASSGKKFDYTGIKTCAAAHLIQEGPVSCGYGCIGFGDCVKACPYNAIYIRDGVAEVLASRCKACALCAAACPKKLIELTPVSEYHMVRCMNRDRGAVARKNCSVGCIGCRRCTTVCQVKAITVQDNLASINPAKCRHCGECVKICPQKCIWYYDCVMRRVDAAN